MLRRWYLYTPNNIFIVILQVANTMKFNVHIFHLALLGDIHTCSGESKAWGQSSGPAIFPVHLEQLLGLGYLHKGINPTAFRTQAQTPTPQHHPTMTDPVLLLYSADHFLLTFKYVYSGKSVTQMILADIMPVPFHCVCSEIQMHFGWFFLASWM